MEVVAHVDGDERAEAAHDEHARRQGEDDEEQGGVVEDEVDALLMSVPDAREAGWPLRGPRGLRPTGGRGLSGRDEGDGGDEQAGADEAGGVDEVAD